MRLEKSFTLFYYVKASLRLIVILFIAQVTGGRIDPACILQVLFGEKSQICSKLKNPFLL